MTRPEPDWDPSSDEVLGDQVRAYDDMRQRCPVAHSELLGWSLFRHQDVSRALADPETFSNVVSTRRSVPNGMDPPEHTAYRSAIDPHLQPGRVRDFEPTCGRIARELVAMLDREVELDLMAAFAAPFAAACQCAYLGWPGDLAGSVLDWSRRNRDAILAMDRSALSTIAEEFRSFVVPMLNERRRAGDDAPDDITTALVRTQVRGRHLSDDELTSVFRNWTVGEVGSVAAAIGMVAGRLAQSPDLQRQTRNDLTGLPAFIEEVLRVEGPLVANRRRVTRDVTVGGRRIVAGESVTLMWISANRDERAFDRSREVQVGRDQATNLVWGAGVHVCPGATLARLETRLATEALLSSTERITRGSEAPSRLPYPENGWATFPVVLRGRAPVTRFRENASDPQGRDQGP